MEIQSRSLTSAPRAARAAVQPPAEPSANMAVDTFTRVGEVVAEPAKDLVQSIDDKEEFNEVATAQSNDLYTLRSTAYVPSTVKQVADAGKAAAEAIATKVPVTPAGPTGFWGKLGTGLGVLDIGTGAMQTLQGISQLRVGEKRDGWVNVTGGASFVASSALYLAGRSVLGPIAATASCVIPGINELMYGLKQHDNKRILSAGTLLAGGAGFAAMAAMAATGLGAGATVLGLPLMTALGIGTSALLIGRAVIGGWDSIKDLAGRIAGKFK